MPVCKEPETATVPGSACSEWYRYEKPASCADASSKDGSREGRGEWQQDAASRLSADERRWGEDQGLLSSSQASAAPADRPWYHDRQVRLPPLLSILPNCCLICFESHPQCRRRTQITGSFQAAMRPVHPCSESGGHWDVQSFRS